MQTRTRMIAAFGIMAALVAPVKAAVSEPSRNDFDLQILTLHNQARDDKRLPRLQWNAGLAKAAEGWARKLAIEGRLRHSGSQERQGAGENLWMGSRGYFGPDKMVGAFIDEKRDFRPGVFPKVSKTGRWEDVGHYTQIIWPTTRAIGCAVATRQGTDYLVCRFYPAGNVLGQSVP